MKIDKNSWVVPGLGIELNEQKIRELSKDVWGMISIKAFETDNIDFIDTFIEFINFVEVSIHFKTNSMSEMMMDKYSESLSLVQMSYEKIINKSFVIKHENKLDMFRLKKHPLWPVWYPDQQPLSIKTANAAQQNAGTTSITIPTVRKVGIVGGNVLPDYIRRRKQATEEERREAELKAGIDNTVKPEEIYGVNEKQLPSYAVKIKPPTFTRPILKQNKESKYYEYKDIYAPNPIAQRHAINPLTLNDILKSLPEPSVPLSDSRYIDHDGLWWPETKLEKVIQFVVCSQYVDINLWRAYKKEIWKFSSFVSQSKYLTPEIVLEYGELLDWKHVPNYLYTPEIIKKFPQYVNLKYVLMMEGIEDFPQLIEYRARIDGIIDDYLKKKQDLLEKTTRNAFVQEKMSCNNDDCDDQDDSLMSILMTKGDF